MDEKNNIVRINVVLMQIRKFYIIWVIRYTYKYLTKPASYSMSCDSNGEKIACL